MASKNREKDQAMAARLKADGDRRRSFRCPICNKIVAIEQAQQHVGHHPA
jgi:hypothetical protein